MNIINTLTFNFLKITKYNAVNKFVTRFYTPRRALMYVPGDDVKKLNKALGLKVDCIAMDCEDGVAINKKHVARETIRNILEENATSKNKLYDLAVRVNSVESGLCEEDVSVVLSGKQLPNTILLPKVDGIDHLRWFSDKLNVHIKENKKVNLIIYIESAVAMINLPEICKEALELSKNNKFIPASLVFGSDDFCANIGVTRSDDSMEILYARQKLVLVAKAFNLQAIDMVYIQYKDLDGLRRQCEEGAKMGYTGKQVIHPGQIEIVQNTFIPSEKSYNWATKVLQAFEEQQQSGKGAFNFQGNMIDMPTVKQAKNIIALYELVKNKK